MLGNRLERFHATLRRVTCRSPTAHDDPGEPHDRTHTDDASIDGRSDWGADPRDGAGHLVAVLKGAFMFLSDLTRAMTRPITLDFMAVSSYGNDTRSSGKVRVVKDVDTSLHNRNVIIIEDIVDTGLTLASLRDILRARSPKSLRAACLLSKPSRRLIDVAVDYVGFEIEDHFVVGYGLDHCEQFRQLPYIAVFK
jgi:hypoxanthine phosphoribosyltransferase